MITNAFQVPDGTVTPCTTNVPVFTDPALDPDPDWWTTLDTGDRHTVALAKQAAETRALNQCAGCSVLDECRDWAKTADVFGVAGGTRHHERGGRTPDAVDRYLLEGKYPDRDALVRIWLRKGFTLSDIADRLGVTVNVVARIRDRLTASTTAAAIKDSATRWGRVSPATAALYTLLADADGPVTKDAAIATMITAVPQTEALARAPKNREYTTVEAKAASGARRYAQNLIRIAVRNRNVFEAAHGTTSVLTLDPDVADTWRTWRALQSA